MITKLYNNRFEVFFSTLILVLFGSLLIPSPLFENYFSDILLQINLLTGILLISKQKKLVWFFGIMLFLAAVIFTSSLVNSDMYPVFGYLRLIIYFTFYITVCYEIVKQVWLAKKVDKSVIIGLLSGYVSIGLVGFFMLLSIETNVSGSFEGISTDPIHKTDDLVYYSYITMLTIGYGDISPITPVAKKASILIGLIGQFYMVIITGIILGKYVNQSSKLHPDYVR